MASYRWLVTDWWLQSALMGFLIGTSLALYLVFVAGGTLNTDPLF